MGTLHDNPNDNSTVENLVPSTFHEEEQAFGELLSKLRESHPGEFVAITGREMVDHDSDAFLLGKRVREKYEGQFVLIRSVDQDDSEFDFAKPLANDI